MSTWEKYPFIVDGVEFVSLIDPTGKMYEKVSMLPDGIFRTMNEKAIKQLIGKVSLMSRNEIQDKLDFINENYSEAYVALV